MKHILYIHQYFKTPKDPGGTRSYWIAKQLIDEGYRVTMLTTSSTISKNVENKKIDGINVVYLKIPYNQKMGAFVRLISFLRFMFKSTYYAFKIKEIDLLIATSTPLTVGFPALLLKIFKRKPYLFEVRDLWPEVPIQMGAISNKFVIKLLQWFERIIYKNSCHVVALSPGMQKGVLEQGVPIEKTSLISNMAKIDVFWSREKNKKLLIDFDLKEDSFKIIHFGALGEANGAIYIIEAAKILKDNKEIEFVFVGGGSLEDDLVKECKDNGLTNVSFLGAFNMEMVSEIVNICDISVVTFKNLPILYTNSPNKLFDSLSAGRPIIVNSNGWTRKLVEKNKCGFYVNPTKPEEFVEKIIYLKGNEKQKERMGLAARNLAEVKYDKKILCREFTLIIEKLLLDV